MCVAVVLSVHHFASHSVLLCPPHALPLLPSPPPTYSLLSTAALLAQARINHHGCIATSLLSFSPPSHPPPTKVPQH